MKDPFRDDNNIIVERFIDYERGDCKSVNNIEDTECSIYLNINTCLSVIKYG